MRDISLSAGVSQNYLGSILHEGSEPSIERMMKLCDELGVSVTYLLLGVDLTGNAEQMLRAYAMLNEEQQKTVLALVKSMAPAARRALPAYNCSGCKRGRRPRPLRLKWRH